MEFEWDEGKRLAGIVKHGVDLLYASAIFSGETFVFEDSRADYGETRWIALGLVDGEVVVVFTEREGRIRLISARKGGRRDRRKFEARLAGGNPGPEGPG